MLRKLIILVCFLAVFGCATIITGTRQSILVESHPSGAKAAVDGYDTKTPGLLVLKKRNQPYIIRVSKRGYHGETVTIGSKLQPWFWGNILFGGFIGMIVDAATGAMWNLTPPSIMVSLEKSESGEESEAEERPLRRGTQEPEEVGQEAREGDLAALDIQVSGGIPPGLNLDFLSRKIRTAGVKYTAYRVMTKENIFAVIQDKKIDLSRCTEAQCVVDYGRMLQADKLVVSTLTYSNGVYFLIMELYDIRTAAIERSASKKCKRCGFAELLEMVDGAAREVFTGEVE